MTAPPHRIVVRSKAEADVEKAADWYRREDPTRAREFLAEVRSAIARAAANPDLHQRLRKKPEVRRVLTKRLPYRVLFVRRDDQVIVFRVLHGARHDREWKRDIPKD